MGVRFSQQYSNSSNFRVLILDDDVDWSDTTRQLLQKVYSVERVDVAKSCSEADSFVARHSYDVVIVDAFLTELLAAEGDDLVRGDRWLLNNLDRIAPVLAAVVTGYPHPLVPSEIKSRNIKLITKATPKEDELYETIGQLAGENNGEVKHEQPSQERALSSLEIELRVLFGEWAERLENAGVGTFFVGGKNLSARDLAREVEEGTKAGKEILLLFTRHLRAKLTGKYPG